MSRVLVTGAGGFIGRATLAPLCERGWDVHAVSRHAGPRGTGVRWHGRDLLEHRAAADVIAATRPSHLLHLAWDTTPARFWHTPENLRWVEASLRLLKAFVEAGGRRVVMAGTCAEYAWGDKVHCVEGTTPLEPATLYGASKHAVRVAAERYTADAGVQLAWGRVFFVFGPYERRERLAASVASSLVRCVPVETSDGAQVRDFLYSEDLAEAFVALLVSDVGGAVNLASGRPVPIRMLIEALAAAAGRPDLLRVGARPARRDEPAVLTADVRRLREEVGWEPARTLAERASDTVAWWRRALAA